MLQQGVYIGVFRELYEAFTVYSFMHLMTDFMEELAKVETTRTGTRQTVTSLLNGPNGSGHAEAAHMFPVSLLERAGLMRPWAMQSADGQSSPFFTNCKRGVLQYVPMAVLGSVGAALMEWLGVFHESKIRWGRYATLAHGLYHYSPQPV